MENKCDKTNMSLDDIIRASRMCHPKVHNRNCEQNERGRSRSRSRRIYRGQQWRLERGQQHQHLIDTRPRSRSRSQISYRSNSQISQLSAPCIPSRCRSLPRQSYSSGDQRPNSVPPVRLRSRLGVNIRKNSPGFSAFTSSTLRPTSLQQLRLAKKRVQVAKNILNARHQSYLKQLRQYRNEILEDSFLMPQYRWRNVQEFPGLFSEIRDCNKASHHHIGRQRVHTLNYPEGTLSVTFENELANSQNHTRTVEEDTVPLGFKPSQALSAPPQIKINGYTIQNPSLGKLATNIADSLPVLVSSSDFQGLLYKHNDTNMDEKRRIHPVNSAQTLNQRFSNYRVMCL